MDDKTKKRIEVAVMLFIAVIFVTSYAAFGNNSAGLSTTSTTTVSTANTLLVYGATNAIIENYSYTAYVTAANKNQSAQLNQTLNKLESNGTVYNYAPNNASTYIVILSGSMNAYQLYLNVSKALNDSNALVGGTAQVRLPPTIAVGTGVGASSALIQIPAKNYTLPLQMVLPIGSNVPITVQMVVTTSGQIVNQAGNPRLIYGGAG